MLGCGRRRLWTRWLEEGLDTGRCAQRLALLLAVAGSVSVASVVVLLLEGPDARLVSIAVSVSAFGGGPCNTINSVREYAGHDRFEPRHIAAWLLLTQAGLLGLWQAVAQVS